MKMKKENLQEKQGVCTSICLLPTRQIALSATFGCLAASSVPSTFWLAGREVTESTPCLSSYPQGLWG